MKDNGSAPSLPRNRFLAFVKRLISEDFYRDLVSVVIGIVLTFGASALIRQCSDRKETKNVLTMVKHELSDNLAMIAAQKGYLAHEKSGATAMLPYIHDPERLPVDSLSKYLDVLSRSRYFVLPDNSFAVLKNSKQAQSLGNNELMRGLFATYADMTHFQSSIQTHNSLKDSGLFEYYSNLDSDLFRVIYEEIRERNDPHMIFPAMMRGSALLRNHIVATAGGSNDYLIPRADTLIAEIEAVIDMIEKEVGR